jgi:CRISPR-associated RAMP protein (TIGR02581 family)
MTRVIDLSTFTSRLHLQGNLEFKSAFRVGAERSLAVDGPDTPVLRDVTGLPYIPGSSFKGALRSYVEAVARAFQAQEDFTDHNLACEVVGKPNQRPDNDPHPGLCLHQEEVSLLKEAPPKAWHTDRRMPAVLVERLPDPETIAEAVEKRNPNAVLDETLWELSCWTCRLFGAPWLSSKVFIKDLALLEETFFRTEVRDGVAIDRDAGRVAGSQKYQFETVPAGAAFELEILVENASPAELGLLWLGIGAFERGEVLLGGAKSRGLGWCRLTTDWEATQYTTPDNLLDLALPTETTESQVQLSAETAQQWVAAFAEEIGARGGSHA